MTDIKQIAMKLYQQEREVALLEKAAAEQEAQKTAEAATALKRAEEKRELSNVRADDPREEQEVIAVAIRVELERLRNRTPLEILQDEKKLEEQKAIAAAVQAELERLRNRTSLEILQDEKKLEEAKAKKKQEDEANIKLVRLKFDAINMFKHQQRREAAKSPEEKVATVNQLQLQQQTEAQERSNIVQAEMKRLRNMTPLEVLQEEKLSSKMLLEVNLERRMTLEKDGWEEIYATEKFGRYVPKNNAELAKLKEGVYYQTYGGGPEGGYVIVNVTNSTFVDGCHIYKGDVYKVERSWITPFKATKCEGKSLAFCAFADFNHNLSYGMNNNRMYIRLQ